MGQGINSTGAMAKFTDEDLEKAVKSKEITPEQAEDFKKHRAEVERDMKLRKASHEIAQAAHILCIFNEIPLFQHRGSNTDFAKALSDLALEAIVQNKLIWDEVE